MKNLLKIFWICAILISFGTNIIFAQEVSTDTLKSNSFKIRGWFNGGIGLGSFKLGANGNLNLQFNNVLISYKQSINGSLTGDALHETCYLVGYVKRNEDFHVSILVGSSSVLFEGNTLFERSKRINTRGFVIEAQLCKNLGDFFGAGISLYANLNDAQNLFGVNFNLFIGYIGL